MLIPRRSRLEVVEAIKQYSRTLDFARHGQPTGVALTEALTHGALQQLAESEDVAPTAFQISRFLPLREELLDLEPHVKDFFYKLDGGAFLYDVPSSLISHLAFPHEGRTWSVDNSHSHLSVAITFIGQFIDHDLTKNIVDLVVREQDELPLQDFASPLVDLDSVYGPRYDKDALTSKPASPAPVANDQFQLEEVGPGKFDAKRDSAGKALIPDARNDENQVILQVHVLVMRLHNAIKRRNTAWDFDRVRRETVSCWQSMVLNDYLASVVDENTRLHVMGELAKVNFGDLVYKPGTPVPGQNPLRMPHEFGLGFRFGHSQLRSHYALNEAHTDDRMIPLFDNRSVAPFPDLRGGRPLTADRVIDWPFFLDTGVATRTSSRIDRHVTRRVFDLPESAIPDRVTKIGNLPQRNLIRSAGLRLASGEYLADQIYGLSERLTPDEVEWESQFHPLFVNEVMKKGSKSTEFATPLWYYILREAEVKQGGDRLGPLGGRLVAEVVAGGVYYDTTSYVHANPSWQSPINGTNVVTFRNIVDYVLRPD